MENSNDVHIVDSDAVARRQAWEIEQLRRLLDQQQRALADLVARDRYEEKAAAVRDECEGHLRELLADLRPYVDGTAGEPTAGMAAVYERAVGRLASLYQVAGRLRAVTVLPVWPEPEPVEAAGERERRAVAAVAEARAAVAGQLVAAKAKMIEQGLATDN